MSPRDYPEEGLVERPALALRESLGYEVAAMQGRYMGREMMAADGW